MIVNEHGRTHPEVGDPALFVDEQGVIHHALVTAVWGVAESPSAPALNLCYVSGDETQSDGYGRTVIRRSSVVYTSQQPAHGNYWSFAEDTE